MSIKGETNPLLPEFSKAYPTPKSKERLNPLL